MLTTTQQVGLLVDPDEVAMRQFIGLPLEAVDARVIGPAATPSNTGPLPEYVVAIRATDQGPFDQYYLACELDMEAAGVSLVGLVGLTTFENAIIEAFIPEGMEVDE